MQGLENDKCSKCNKKLEYYERHYITETKKKAVSVWCYNCFITEMSNRTGKKLCLNSSKERPLKTFFEKGSLIPKKEKEVKNDETGAFEPRMERTRRVINQI